MLTIVTLVAAASLVAHAAGQQMSDRCQQFPNLTFSRVVHSNLGGHGPDQGEEGLILEAFDVQIQRSLHLVINAMGQYTPAYPEQNGLRGAFGTLNIESGTATHLRFLLREPETGDPARLPQVAFTFFDLDQCQSHHCVEFITVGRQKFQLIKYHASCGCCCPPIVVIALPL